MDDLLSFLDGLWAEIFVQKNRLTMAITAVLFGLLSAVCLMVVVLGFLTAAY